MVIIHKSNEYLDDVKSLEKYVMEELNVRKITLSGDKDRYGITLKAQPDHVLLGKRLKGLTVKPACFASSIAISILLDTIVYA